MSMLQKKGTYLAQLGSTTIEQKDTKTVFFNAYCKCTQERNGNAWQPLDGDQAIMARLNLVKTDGNLNEINVKALTDSLGWDGTFSSLQREDGWGDTEVQIVVGEEQYEGKTQLKVQYLNPKDYTGGGSLKASDQQLIQSLDAKYGPMLRALGGVGRQPGASTTAKNGNGKHGAPAVTDAMGKQLAWATFCHKCDEYGRDNPAEAYTNEQKQDTFREVVKDVIKTYFPNTEAKALSDAQWAKVKQEIDKDFSAATRGLIPI